MQAFDFTNNWFGMNGENNWKEFLPKIKPRRVLEIGSFEGRSASFLIQLNDWCEELDLFCVDTWEGSVEHKDAGTDMNATEKKFDNNIYVAQRSSENKCNLYKIKSTSHLAMTQLIANKCSNSFDFIYVDGSHQAPDVLLDAVLAFKLCRVGGVIGFDDYTWSEAGHNDRNLLRCPKLAIDAFTTVFAGKVDIINAPISQVYVQKRSD